MKSLSERMADADGTHAPSWKAEPGDWVVATVEKYGVASGNHGPVNTVTLFVQDCHSRGPGAERGRECTLWLFSTVLLELFRTHRPQIGDQVGVKYLGKPEGKAYHLWVLEVEKRRPDPKVAPSTKIDDPPKATDTTTRVSGPPAPPYRPMGSRTLGDQLRDREGPPEERPGRRDSREKFPAHQRDLLV